MIALHTVNSRTSQWLPYERGRAKARYLYSRDAAGWFAPGESPATCGDYVRLTVMCRNGEGDVLAWLAGVAGKPVAHNVPPACRCPSRPQRRPHAWPPLP